MILPEKVKLPDWVNRAEVDKYLKSIWLLPGDSIELTWAERRDDNECCRKIKIRCRGVWFNCLCFRIAGYTVREIT